MRHIARVDITGMYAVHGGQVAPGKVPILFRSIAIGASAIFVGNSRLDRRTFGRPNLAASGSIIGTRKTGGVRGKIMLLPCAGGVFFQGTAREKKIHRSGNDPDVNRTGTF
jgi:hypothetical protein